MTLADPFDVSTRKSVMWTFNNVVYPEYGDHGYNPTNPQDAYFDLKEGTQEFYECPTTNNVYIQITEANQAYYETGTSFNDMCLYCNNIVSASLIIDKLVSGDTEIAQLFSTGSKNIYAVGFFLVKEGLYLTFSFRYAPDSFSLADTLGGEVEVLYDMQGYGYTMYGIKLLDAADITLGEAIGVSVARAKTTNTLHVHINGVEKAEIILSHTMCCGFNNGGAHHRLGFMSIVYATYFRVQGVLRDVPIHPEFKLKDLRYIGDPYNDDNNGRPTYGVLPDEGRVISSLQASLCQ
jgi:hypothetical protein